MDAIEIFFSYAHEDEALMNEVRRQLVVYERNGRILKWHDRQIPVGTEWRSLIDWRLNQAKIVLLFVSPHFMDSRYCYEIEGQVALRRHDAGEARVIPVILRPCSWQDAPFGKLQVLPHDGKPISQWQDRDQASLEVARGVMAVVDELIVQPTPSSAIQQQTSQDLATSVASESDRGLRITATHRETIKINILSESRGERIEMELPLDAQVRYLLPVITEALKMPNHAPD
jgi:TIR domain